MKLSASSRRPSSFSETPRLGDLNGSLPGHSKARAALACLKGHRIKEDRSRRSALKSVSSEIGMGMPAAATWAGGPKSSLAFPATLSAPSSRRRERHLGVDVEPRMVVAAAGELGLNALVGGQFAGYQPERHASRASLDRQGPISFWPSIETFSA